MSTIDDALNANQQYASTFTDGDRSAPPTKRVAIITCMDARGDPRRVMGGVRGDAPVIRNAGGRVAEAIRSLVISQALLGTEEVAVIHHTECGMLSFSNERLRTALRAQGASAEDIDFLAFSDLEQSVRDDIAIYRQSPMLRQDAEVRGFIYDVKTGRLSEVW
jgi:carbonic anhydrase